VKRIGSVLEQQLNVVEFASHERLALLILMPSNFKTRQHQFQSALTRIFFPITDYLLPHHRMHDKPRCNPRTLHHKFHRRLRRTLCCAGCFVCFSRLDIQRIAGVCGRGAGMKFARHGFPREGCFFFARTVELYLALRAVERFVVLAARSCALEHARKGVCNCKGVLQLLDRQPPLQGLPNRRRSHFTSSFPSPPPFSSFLSAINSVRK